MIDTTLNQPPIAPVGTLLAFYRVVGSKVRQYHIRKTARGGVLDLQPDDYAPATRSRYSDTELHRMSKTPTQARERALEGLRHKIETTKKDLPALEEKLAAVERIRA